MKAGLEYLMDMDSNKWASRLVKLSRDVAQWSKDESTKVGAFITTPTGEPISWGYNGFPIGVSDIDPKRNERPMKYKFTCHAERNALDLARSSTDGTYMFVTLSPCTECAKSIIQKRVAKVFVDVEGAIHNAPEHWREDMTIARDMLIESGVDYVTVHPSLP